MAELQADPEWVAARDARARRDELAEANCREQQAPLVADLSAADVPVMDIWDLVNSTRPYPAAIPVLAMHLHRDYEDAILEGIARAMAVPDAAPFWDQVMTLFRSADPANVRVYQALAAGLSGMATRSLLPQIRAALRDRSLGPGRTMFLSTLTRLPAPDRWDTIADLVDDPEVGPEASRLLHQRELRRNARSRRAAES